jgi:phosphoribosylformylglycinamidine synthase PurS subunit
MRATVVVRLKPEVLDPQGDAVRRALDKLGFQGIGRVRVGKLIEIEMDDGPSEAELAPRLRQMADDLLANPVIEDFEIQI